MRSICFYPLKEQPRKCTYQFHLYPLSRTWCHGFHKEGWKHCSLFQVTTLLAKILLLCKKRTYIDGQQSVSSAISYFGRRVFYPCKQQQQHTHTNMHVSSPSYHNFVCYITIWVKSIFDVYITKYYLQLNVLPFLHIRKHIVSQQYLYLYWFAIPSIKLNFFKR